MVLIATLRWHFNGKSNLYLFLLRCWESRRKKSLLLYKRCVQVLLFHFCEIFTNLKKKSCRTRSKKLRQPRKQTRSIIIIKEMQSLKETIIMKIWTIRLQEVNCFYFLVSFPLLTFSHFSFPGSKEIDISISDGLISQENGLHCELCGENVGHIVFHIRITLYWNCILIFKKGKESRRRDQKIRNSENKMGVDWSWWNYCIERSFGKQ